MSVPGFAAEAAISKQTEFYYSETRSHLIEDRAVMPAAQRSSGDDMDWVDCKDFPNNITCLECGIGPPWGLRCCRDENKCVVMNPPEPQPGRRWPAFSSRGHAVFAI